MNVKSAVFRFRVWIFLAIYLLGFLAPWERLFHSYGRGTLWLAASTLAARTGWMSLAASTRAVTLAALCACLSGALLRVWGAATRYRRTRNALGSVLFALGVSILMSPGGACFFLLALGLFQWLLLSAEESVPASAARPQWLQAFLMQIFFVGYALCFAVLAWRYDIRILTKCLIVCFGLSIIARALRVPSSSQPG